MLRLFVSVYFASIVLIVSETTLLENLLKRPTRYERSVRPKSKEIVFPKSQENAAFTEPARSFLLHILKHKLSHQKIERISTTPPPTDCICVPYYLCDINQTIITDGVGTIDIRYRRCTGDLEVCCYPPSIGSSMAPIVTPTMTTMPPTSPPTTPTTPTSPPTTPTTPTTPPTTPTTPTTPPTTPTTPPTTPTTPPTTMPPTTVPNPPIIFPTAPPTPQPTVVPTGPPGLNCICVQVWQCDPNGIVGVSGEGVINPRQQIGICPSPDQVCCTLLLNGVEFPTAPPVLSPVTIPGQSQICIICGNTLQCTNGIIIPNSGIGIINPRLTYLSRQSTCSVPNTCCPGSNSVDGSLVLPGLGQLKNPGTPQACYCVKTWQCGQGYVVSVDGAGVIDPRFSWCTASDEVCCQLPGINLQGYRESSTVQNAYIVSSVTEPTPPAQISCGVQDKTFAPSQPYPPDSGKTYFAEFPWMVALLVEQANGQFLFQCGASLINSKVVLTAAHCVTNRENGKLVARVGQWDLESSDQPAPFQEVNVKTIVPHPLYYSGGLFHDIAVLILEEAVTYDMNIIPICLPQQGEIFATGTRCFGTGWGRNSFGTDGKYQAELRKVDLPIVDRSDCQSRLRTTKLGQYFQLHGSFICAGGEPNRDTCRGDGGGPLACPAGNGRYVQAGIVSWGIGCGMSNIPAVYASVSQHRQWIDQQLANYGVQ